MINAALAGLVIVTLRSWKSPFHVEECSRSWPVYGSDYGDPLRIVHVVIGALVVILSAVELWRSAKT